MLRLALAALALAALPPARAQPFPEAVPLGPLTATADGQTLPLHPLAAAADGDGWVVFAMSAAEPQVAFAERGRPWALRLDADGAVTDQRRLSAGIGHVKVVLDPLAAPTMRPDGDGWLVGGSFTDRRALEDGRDRDALRAVRIAPDLSAERVAERVLGPASLATTFDVLRLGEDLVLFAGRLLGQGGQSFPLAVAVASSGGEKVLVEPTAWSGAFTSATVAGAHIVLAGWTRDRSGPGRDVRVETFDATLAPVAARQITTEGVPAGARIAPLGDERVVLAAAVPDSAGTGRERVAVAVLSVPGVEVAGSAFAGEHAGSRYAVDALAGLQDVGVVTLAREPLGNGLSRAVLLRHPEGGAAGWTVPVGTGAPEGRTFAIGLHADGAAVLSAVRDSADVWHLELARLHTERPSPPWLAPLSDAAVTDAAAFDAYVRAMLSAVGPADRGDALSAYGRALDAAADSAAVSHELQRQAAALLAHDAGPSAEAIVSGGPRLLLRVRPGLPVEQQRCIASLYLWRLQTDRARRERTPLPARPATDCD